mmetsp:Transcript_88122/g.254320  ORF Transcript_88122/g.254320 Transcript_88122/m.254320 type:complete len:246 (+) Transcript_88122:430-1167(+)
MRSVLRRHGCAGGQQQAHRVRAHAHEGTDVRGAQPVRRAPARGAGGEQGAHPAATAMEGSDEDGCDAVLLDRFHVRTVLDQGLDRLYLAGGAGMVQGDAATWGISHVDAGAVMQEEAYGVVVPVPCRGVHRRLVGADTILLQAPPLGAINAGPRLDQRLHRVGLPGACSEQQRGRPLHILCGGGHVQLVEEAVVFQRGHSAEIEPRRQALQEGSPQHRGASPLVQAPLGEEPGQPVVEEPPNDGR